MAALMLVVSTAAPAQKYYDHEVSAETVAWDLRDMMERFTRYIEIVGTTQTLSNGVYTPNRKVNAIIKPAVMPELISGRTTLKNAWTGVQPRSCAASGMLGSTCLSLGSTLRIT